MISDDYLNFMTHEGHGVSTTYWRNIIFTGKTGFKTFSSLCQTIIWNEHKGRLNKKVDALIYNVIIRSSALETTSPLVLNKCGGWAECLEWIPSIWRHTAHLNLINYLHCISSSGQIHKELQDLEDTLRLMKYTQNFILNLKMLSTQPKFC